MSRAVQAGPDTSDNFSVTRTPNEKRQVTGVVLVGTKTTPKPVKVYYRDGGIMFK